MRKILQAPADAPPRFYGVARSGAAVLRTYGYGLSAMNSRIPIPAVPVAPIGRRSLFFETALHARHGDAVDTGHSVQNDFLAHHCGQPLNAHQFVQRGRGRHVMPPFGNHAAARRPLRGMQ